MAPKKIEIRATVIFNRRNQGQEERLVNFVTDLRILVKGCGYQDGNRMLHDARVLRSFHPMVREKCLEKGNELTLRVDSRLCHCQRPELRNITR